LLENKLYNRWLVVVGGLISQFCLGALYTWSVFQRPIQEAMGWNAAEVSLAFTLNLAVLPVCMLLTGKLLDRIGPTKMAIIGGSFLFAGLMLTSRTVTIGAIWPLYIGYGVLAGGGIGMAYGVPVATCVRWFPDKRGMIAGLAVFGFGMGSVFWAPVATQLVINFGPFTTFMIQAIYSIVGVVIGASLMRAAPDNFKPQGWEPPAPQSGKVGASLHNFTTTEMLKTPNYYILFIMYVFVNVAGLMIIGHASPIGQQVAGLSVVEAGSIVSILALLNAFGRLFWGTMSDKIGRMKVVFLLYAFSAIAMFSMNFLNSYWLYAFGVGLVAFCFGGAMGTFPSVTADFFGAKYVSTNYGFVFLAYSVGAIIGPRLAAVINISNGSYQLAFLISGALCVVGAIMAFITKAPQQPA